MFNTTPKLRKCKEDSKQLKMNSTPHMLHGSKVFTEIWLNTQDRLTSKSKSSLKAKQLTNKELKSNIEAKLKP